MPCDACTTPTTCKLVGCEKGKEYELAHPKQPDPPPAPEPAVEPRYEDGPAHEDRFPSEPAETPNVELDATNEPEPEVGLNPTEPETAVETSGPPSPEQAAPPSGGESPEDVTPQGADTSPPEAAVPAAVRDQRRREAVPPQLRARLDTAVELAREQFPQARQIRPGIHGMEVYVEVWDDHEAKLYALSGETI